MPENPLHIQVKLASRSFLPSYFDFERPSVPYDLLDSRVKVLKRIEEPVDEIEREKYAGKEDSGRAVDLVGSPLPAQERETARGNLGSFPCFHVGLQIG